MLETQSPKLFNSAVQLHAPRVPRGLLGYGVHQVIHATLSTAFRPFSATRPYGRRRKEAPGAAPARRAERGRRHLNGVRIHDLGDSRTHPSDK